MAGSLKISEAATLALHAMALLAGQPRSLHSTKGLASQLRVSENHLAKVLQRLQRAGLLDSMRGPKGGFRLALPPREINLLMVYEAVEGPFKDGGCLLGRPACQGDCMLGGLVRKMGGEVRDYLARVNLGDLSGQMAPAMLGQAGGNGVC